MNPPRPALDARRSAYLRVYAERFGRVPAATPEYCTQPKAAR